MLLNDLKSATILFLKRLGCGAAVGVSQHVSAGSHQFGGMDYSLDSPLFPRQNLGFFSVEQFPWAATLKEH
jgi:hypothetical protein